MLPPLQANSPAAFRLVSQLDHLGGMPDVVYKLSPPPRQRPAADCKGGDWFKLTQKGVLLLDFTTATDIEVDDDQNGVTCVTALGPRGRWSGPRSVAVRGGSVALTSVRVAPAGPP